MRRFQALLAVAGLAAAPASAVAGPSSDPRSPSQIIPPPGPSWFREWITPFEPEQTSPSDQSEWLRELRELFRPAQPNKATLRS